MTPKTNGLLAPKAGLDLQKAIFMSTVMPLAPTRHRGLGNTTINMEIGVTQIKASPFTVRANLTTTMVFC